MRIATLCVFGLASAWTVEKGGVAVTGQGESAERDSLDSLVGPVELYHGTTLDVAFKVVDSAPVKRSTDAEDGESTSDSTDTSLPHQVFVRVSPKNEPNVPGIVDKIVRTRVRGNGAKVAIPFSALPVALHNYDLEVSALLSSLDGRHAEIHLFDLVAYGEDDAQRLPLARMAGRAPGLAAKPTISHQFPAPPRHVRPVFALAAATAVGVLFLGLLLAWLGVLSSSSLAAPSPIVVAKLGIIAGVEAAFVAYYHSMSIFSLLQYAGAGLAVFLVLSRFEHK